MALLFPHVLSTCMMETHSPYRCGAAANSETTGYMRCQTWNESCLATMIAFDAIQTLGVTEKKKSEVRGRFKR